MIADEGDSDFLFEDAEGLGDCAQRHCVLKRVIRSPGRFVGRCLFMRT